jgi:hypothetical protein
MTKCTTQLDLIISKAEVNIPGAPLIYVLNDVIHGSIVQQLLELNLKTPVQKPILDDFSSVSFHTDPYSKSANGRHAYDLDITDLSLLRQRYDMDYDMQHEIVVNIIVMIS